MPTSEIYNYRKVNDRLITAGQPTEAQLQAAAEEGFTTVINLATNDPKYALPDEAGLVASLGMAYHNIPVDWENPQEGDFAAFEDLLQQALTGKTLIHCVANYRVSAFYALYALKHQGWSEDQADTFRASVWNPAEYPVWEAFIAKIKANIGS